MSKLTVWGAVLGGASAAAFVLYAARPYTVPILGYLFEVAVGAVAGAAVFSIVARLVCSRAQTKG